VTPERRRALIIDSLKIVNEGDSEATLIARAEVIASTLEKEAATEIVERRGDRYLVRQVIGFVLGLRDGAVTGTEADLQRIYDGLGS
jgi:hypothetical protein